MKRLFTIAIITLTLLLSAQILRAGDNTPDQHYHTPEEVTESVQNIKSAKVKERFIVLTR